MDSDLFFRSDDTPAGVREEAERRGQEWLASISPDAVELEWAKGAVFDDLGEGMFVAQITVSPPTEQIIKASGPPTFSLSLCLSGQALFSLDGGSPMKIHPGMAVIFGSDRPTAGEEVIFPGEPFRVIDFRFGEHGLTRFGGSLARQFGTDLLIDRSEPESSTCFIGFDAPVELLREAQKVVTCPFSEPALRKLFLRGVALQALALAFNHLSLNRTARLPFSRTDRQKIARAVALLETGYEEDWTIARLARAVGMSEKKLKVGFRDQVGRTIRTHLRKVRLDAAAEMLRDGHPVTQVALACGFSSLSYFSKAFKDHAGLLPRDYLKRRRLESESRDLD